MLLRLQTKMRIYQVFLLLLLTGGSFCRGNPWRHGRPQAPLPALWESIGSTTSAASPTFPHLAHSDAELGIINVVLPPFSADSSGQKDATAALQGAIEYGRTNNLTVYVPLGRYMITDTLNCTEHKNGRFRPVVIVGQRPTATANWNGVLEAPKRPEFFVPDETPGFTDANNPKYVVHFWEDDSLPRTQTALHPHRHRYRKNRADTTTESDIRTNVNFNQILQGINVVVGAGNTGAIGVRLRGAQGSAIEDCLIDMGTDGLIGVVGACGSGGSHAGIIVIGGRYGLDFRMAQPAPTMTGATLINQKCSALVYSGLQTLTAVGIYIKNSGRPESVPDMLGLIASVPPEVSDEPSPWLPQSGECSMPSLLPNVQPAVPALSGQISLIDAVIDLETSCQSCSAITTPRSLYLKNVYIRNAANLLRMRNGKGGDDNVENKAEGGAWARFDEAAYAIQPPKMAKKYKQGWLPLQYESTIWVDDKRQAENQTHVTFDANTPPDDIVSFHLWDEEHFPSFQSEGAVSVTMPPYNAKGDGRHDDAAAIQQAINEHDIVVLPKGAYRTSRTIQLKQNTQLVGIQRTLSIIMPVTEGIQGGGGTPQPIVATYDGEGSNTIAFLAIANWNHLNNTYSLLWQVHGESHCVWRQSYTFTTREWSLDTNPPMKNSKAEPIQPVNATHPLIVISGGGQFYNLENEDWLHESPSYRHLLVEQSNDLRFYQLNTEHGRGDANTEIRNSSNIEIFGLKSEGNFVVVWMRNVENTTLYGYGGNGAAFPMTDKYPPGYAQYTPSLFRVEKATNLRLIHLIDYGRIQGGNSTFFAGQGFDPHTWSMLLNVDKEMPTPPMDRPVLYLINQE